MVVSYCDSDGFVFLPSEANSVLVVDANTVLAGAASRQLFQAIPSWRLKIHGSPRRSQAIEQSASLFVKLGRERPPRLLARDSDEYVLGRLVAEPHAPRYSFPKSVARCATGVKRG